MFSWELEFYFILFYFIYLFIYFWLCWVFVSVQGLSPAVASGGHSSSRCAGLSLSRPLSLRSTGSRRAGSVVVAHGPSRSTACEILPDQGSNPCPPHWQSDSHHCATREAQESSNFKILLPNGPLWFLVHSTGSLRTCKYHRHVFLFLLSPCKIFILHI